jgi:sigma-B regulation protein RsbU (phosphoserine phosphatase)
MNLKKHDYLLLKNLMDNMTDSIYFKDLKSRFIMVNQTVASSMGFAKPEDLTGKSDFDIFLEDDARQMFEDEQSIIENGEPIADLEEETTWKDGHVAWSWTSKMPLLDDAGSVVGTFGISRNITEHKLAELQAARYAEEVRRIKESMEDDIRMAAELQKTFFPKEYPVFPQDSSSSGRCVEFKHHYHASGAVSGDFCAIHRLSETKCGILQCDVMGHGVRAALGTALICAMVEDLAQQEHDPGRFLERMNQQLLPILRQEDMFLYASACYMVYDAVSGRLRVANAGHPAPLHFQALEGTVSLLMDDSTLRGPALAICENPGYQTAEIQIHPDDVVMMYTDGLYEVTGPAGEEFGEERLLQIAQQHRGIPLAELFPALINEVLQFSEHGTFDDDICLVGFRCRRLGEGEE